MSDLDEVRRKARYLQCDETAGMLVMLANEIDRLQGELDAVSGATAFATRNGVLHLFYDTDEARAFLATGDWERAGWLTVVNSVEVHVKPTKGNHDRATDDKLTIAAREIERLDRLRVEAVAELEQMYDGLMDYDSPRVGRWKAFEGCVNEPTRELMVAAIRERLGIGAKGKPT